MQPTTKNNYIIIIQKKTKQKINNSILIKLAPVSFLFNNKEKEE
jgi:hypothetical protein